MSPQDTKEDLELSAADLGIEGELDLLAYLDGELEGDRAATVLARLKTDKAYAARLRALEAVGDFLRRDADRIYSSARVDQIVDDVLAKVRKPEVREARESAIPISQIAPPTSRYTRQKKGTVIWVAFGAVAAAAAALVFYVNNGANKSTTVPVASTSATAPAETVAVKTPTPPPSNPPAPADETVEVQDLEVGSGATVVYTRGEDGSSPVVWITAREAK
jgi:anti-sigma factor RsiW